MRHWVPAGAQELGRDTAATWELREAGEESLTNRISLSAVFQLKPGMGGRVILAALINCSFISMALMLCSPSLTWI
jgi:hypothetical protein